MTRDELIAGVRELANKPNAPEYLKDFLVKLEVEEEGETDLSVEMQAHLRSRLYNSLAHPDGWRPYKEVIAELRSKKKSA